MFYILSLFLSFLILLYPSIIKALPIGIHKMIAYEASLLKTVPSEIGVYIGNLEHCPSNFKDNICEGTYDEDADRDPRLNPGNPFTWISMLNWGTHFWNPEEGPDGGLLINVGDIPVNLESKNAYQRAKDLYDQAISIYNYNPSGAYYLLGRVIHLIADMATPAHVHLDAHISDSSITGDDSFEEYLDFLYEDNISGIERFRRDFPVDDFSLFYYRRFNDNFLESPLYKIFYSMASLSKAFDSDDGIGSTDRGKRVGLSIKTEKDISDLKYVWAIKRGSLKKKLILDYQISEARNKLILKESILNGLKNTYDTIKLDFSDGSEVYSLSDFNNSDIGDKDLSEISSVLIPSAIVRTANIYKLFWVDTHPTFSNNFAELTLNKSQKRIELSRPEPVDIAIDVLSKDWQGSDVELYAWIDAIISGNKFRVYFYDGKWITFKDYQDMRPAVVLAGLHDISDFIWAVFEDTSFFPEDILFKLSICIDRDIDNFYTPSESICDGLSIKVN